MDISTIAKMATEFLLPFLKKNKAISQIGDEIKEASNNSLLELWEWAKPIFIEEYSDEKKETFNDYIELAPVVEKDIHKKLSALPEEQVMKIKKLCDQLTEQGGSKTIVTGNDNVVVSNNTGSTISVVKGKYAAGRDLNIKK